MIKHSEAEDWTIWEGLESLKNQAKSAGLWNMFLPLEADPEQRWFLVRICKYKLGYKSHDLL